MYGLYLTYGQPRPLGRKCTRVQPARARRTGEARKSMRVQPARVQAHLPHPRRARFLWGVGTSYNERRLLWEVVRLVQAVSGVRANQPAFMPRLASTAGAEDSMGCGTLCASGILHEKTPAPRGRELYAGSACRAGQPAFMPRLANTAGAGGPVRVYAHLPHPRRAGILWEVIHSIISGGFYGEWCASFGL